MVKGNCGLNEVAIVCLLGVVGMLAAKTLFPPITAPTAARGGQRADTMAWFEKQFQQAEGAPSPAEGAGGGNGAANELKQPPHVAAGSLPDRTPALSW